MEKILNLYWLKYCRLVLKMVLGSVRYTGVNFKYLATCILIIQIGLITVSQASAIESTRAKQSLLVPKAEVCYMTSKKGRNCNWSTCWSAGGKCNLSHKGNCYKTGFNWYCLDNCTCSSNNREGKGPDYISGLGSGQRGGYSVGTGIAKSRGLSSALKSATDEAAGSASDVAYPDENGIMTIANNIASSAPNSEAARGYSVDLKFDYWGIPVSLDSFITSIYKLSEAMLEVPVVIKRQDNGLSIYDHGAFSLGGTYTDEAGGFGTITVMCWGQPVKRDDDEVDGLIWIPGDGYDEGVEYYQDEIYLMGNAEGAVGVQARGETYMDALGNNWFDGRWYEDGQLMCPDH